MRKRKWLLLLLYVAMVMMTLPITVLAEGEELVSEEFCPHHTVHTEDCGYLASQAEIPCDKGCTDMDGDGVTDHVEGCVYTPAVEGQPCAYSCSICSMQESQDLQDLQESAVTLHEPESLSWEGNKATWTAVQNASSYQVQLYYEGKESGAPVSVTGTEHTFPLTYAGTYTFTVQALGTGNYTDSSKATSGSLFSVSFVTNGAGAIDIQFIANGGNATAPTNPEKSGYEFGGWYSNSVLNEESKWDFGTATVTAPTTLYAKFISVPTYAVTIPASVELGGTVTVSASGVTIVEGSQLVVKLTDVQDFKLRTSEGAELSYGITKDSTPLSVGSNVLTVAGGIWDNTGSAMLTFSNPTTAIRYSGEYKGTVSFTVSIEEVSTP